MSLSMTQCFFACNVTINHTSYKYSHTHIHKGQRDDKVLVLLCVVGLHGKWGACYQVKEGRKRGDDQKAVVVGLVLYSMRERERVC